MDLLSYEILVIVFDFVIVGSSDSFGSSAYSVFEQFLMVLRAGEAGSR